MELRSSFNLFLTGLVAGDLCVTRPGLAMVGLVLENRGMVELEQTGVTTVMGDMVVGVPTPCGDTFMPPPQGKALIHEDV